MCHAVLQDPDFFRFLSRIDAELATETRQARCIECNGPLHVADFPRKPRGCPASVREEYSSRLSFTCGWCDARSTPASVRFLGRRVYVAVMLMLISPAAGCASRTMGELLEVPVRTVARWRSWWQRDFQRTRFWQSVRERFVPPLTSEELPQGLLARFRAERGVQRITQMLRFISPLSTASVSK
ncbi:MAG: hypothetical protein ACRES6_09950 [Steroidobacteraceae bacterium]